MLSLFKNFIYLTLSCFYFSCSQILHDENLKKKIKQQNIISIKNNNVEDNKKIILLKKNNILSIIFLTCLFFGLYIPYINNILINNYDAPQSIQYKYFYNQTYSIKSLYDSNISFISQSDRLNKLNHKFPPYLISYGGSGNTFTRLLLEYSTNYYTGSIYDSKVLNQTHLFKGESICDTRVLVVKIHPEDIYLIKGNVINKAQLLLNGTQPCTGGERIRKTPKFFRPTIFNFAKNKIATAIYILRDPWKASFALFNLLSYKKSNDTNYLNSPHIHAIKIDDFDIDNFKNFLSKKFYTWSWTIKFIDIHKNLSKVKRQNNTYIIIKYENLISHDFDKKNTELIKIIKFLIKSNENRDYVSYLNTINSTLNKIHNDFRFQSIHRIYNYSINIDINTAYNSLSKKFICNLWDKIKPEASRFGYKNWNNINC